MYTTKVFNAKVAESYLNIGDPYSKQATSDPRLKGKQFQTNPSKSGQLAGFFSPFSYATDAYADSNLYIQTQPRDARKLGFGTHDANRRDEFTLDIRAKQYRQLMAQEKAWEKAYIQRRGVQSAPGVGGEEGKDALERLAATFQTQIPRLQYDIGRTSEGLTPDCAKCERDTFYCPHRLNLSSGECRRRVDHRSHYSEHFGCDGGKQLSQGHQQFTHKSSLNDFFDNNHITIGKTTL